jgi:hypothetical protein
VIHVSKNENVHLLRASARSVSYTVLSDVVIMPGRLMWWVLAATAAASISGV